MIEKFRVEAQHEDKQTLIDQLQDAALKIMAIANTSNFTPHEWECTDDFICKTATGYRGRMVFKIMEEEVVQFGGFGARKAPILKGKR